MSQTERALIGFFAAPAFPGTLLYLYNFFWQGYGDEAVVGPLILGLLGYAAALVLGVPVYLFLHRKGIRSLLAYGLLGALIGPIFFVIFEVLTTYQGTLLVTLRYSYGAAFVAAVYSSLAAIAFWAIAYWPRPKRVVSQ